MDRWGQNLLGGGVVADDHRVQRQQHGGRAVGPFDDVRDRDGAGGAGEPFARDLIGGHGGWTRGLVGRHAGAREFFRLLLDRRGLFLLLADQFAEQIGVVDFGGGGGTILPKIIKFKTISFGKWYFFTIQ